MKGLITELPMRIAGWQSVAATVVLLMAACARDEATAPLTTSSADVRPVSAQVDGAAMAWLGPQKRSLVDAVGTWNDNVIRFGVLALVSPPVEARIYAMGSVAIHDVMNSVDRRYEPYAYDHQVTAPVSVEAALATATHDVLLSIGEAAGATDAVDFIDQAHASYMTPLGAGDQVDRGVQLGHAVAAAILAQRVGDGADGPPASPFTSTGEPGKYRPTLFPSPDGLSGLQAISYWGSITPFVLASASQYRPGPMYGASNVTDAIATPRYLADYDEVKRLGGIVSERTQDQSDIAVFWIENSAPGWNRIARNVAAQRHLDAWNLARMIGHISLSIADGYISVFETKYVYNFWRPVTAIRLGNLNPATPGDPSWEVASMGVGLGPTPPIPDYSSAHAVAGSAAGEAILANIDGAISFTVESGTLPGKPRSFRSIRDAVKENADSRIYIGFHFREATLVGIDQGQRVGRYVTSHSLQRVRGR